MKNLVIGAVAASLFLGLTACGDDPEIVVPPNEGGGGAGGSPPLVEPELPPAAVAPKRTVLQRNPFGNVAVHENLLWDGDFEWSSPFASQYGWYELPSSANLTNVAVGPACKSGIKCARLKKSGDLLGMAVASVGRNLYASAYVKFEVKPDAQVPACGKVKATVFDLGEFAPADPDVKLEPETEMPNEEGWCFFRAEIPARAHKPYMLIANNYAGFILVDDVVLRVADVSPPPANANAKQTAWPLARVADDPESLASIARGRQAVRALRGPQDGAPNLALDAFRTWQEKK